MRTKLPHAQYNITSFSNKHVDNTALRTQCSAKDLWTSRFSRLTTIYLGNEDEDIYILAFFRFKGDISSAKIGHFYFSMRKLS